ncbi:NADPH:quinone reductase [Streptomyces liangshanensis]|uniref:NADPH:quinone reductase n=1 Tax=Streptomyces liangshanensis TaxID=2717324 RepID=A0A6G9GWA0_9ACTN|nr:NADPH:quinone reductase [Streptomyces liangshanensis]QIQ02553.1 NADPH:quinone reductase [Streptomyces liangshanensis]
MRAVVYSEQGSIDVLSLVEREPGEPGPGEVRVRIVRSGVNPSDWKNREGVMGPMSFPEVVPNSDGAGYVDALGEGVDGLAVGDRVWATIASAGRPTGTAQEYTVLPAYRVFPLADGLSFDLGTLGVPAVTAHSALTRSDGGPSRLAPGSLTGRTVLVQGGAGAVGNAAIQLAVWAGAQVVATVSSDTKAALATAAGAHHTVDYTRGDIVDPVRAFAPDGVDIVVEVAPAANFAADLKLVKPRGTIASYSNDGGDDLGVGVTALLWANARVEWVVIPALDPAHLRAAAEDITAAATAGAFRAGEEAGLPLHHFPLDRTAEAHAAAESGTVGKILVDVSDI